MRFEALTKLMYSMWETAQTTGLPLQTVGLFGSPGIGKTSTGRDLAKLMTAKVRTKDATAPEAVCRELDLSSMNPEDLLGLPFRNGDVTSYCPPAWLAALCKPGAVGVLVLDDLPAASPSMAVASRQIALERRVHDHKLADGVFVIVTGNRREDKSAAATLPAHFRNSILSLGVEIDVEEWAKWYGQDERLAPVVAAYLRFKQERLTMLPSDADKKTGAFATPRTWAKVGAQFAVAEANGCLFEVAAGLVGEGVAHEFEAFCKIRAALVDPEKVFDNPEKALPTPDKTLNSPDKLVAMATTLGEIAANRSKHGKGTAKTEAPLKLLKSLAHATSSNREYCGAGVSTFIANGGSLPDMVRVARANRSDPTIGALLTFLKSALMEGP